MNPSPRSHIYRMVIVLVVIMAGFVALKSLAIPDSWNNELFYRVDSLDELKLLPMRISGNAECAGSGCHEQQQLDKHKEHLAALSRGNHSGLACENCHGPMSVHVREGRRVAPALINLENTLCLGCHAPLLSRPKGFPQFDADNTGHSYFDVEITTPCRNCHDPHEPLHMAAAPDKGEPEEGEPEEESATDATGQPRAINEVTQ
ncbi:MAG: hypothetical protein WCH04_16320 [Gammaproteobacteria bacterium]